LGVEIQSLIPKRMRINGMRDKFTAGPLSARLKGAEDISNIGNILFIVSRRKFLITYRGS
jgi:hypothetical protein